MARIELSNIGGGGGGSTTLALTTTGTSGASVLTTVPGGYSLNIPVYQGALSLSTAGTSGASTLVGDTLTIPTYQGQISLTTTGTSGASTFVGNTLNIPTYQGAISLTTTGTSGAATLVGNTLNVPQYSTSPAGSTGEIQYNNAGAFGASANLAWDNTNVRLNVGAPSAPTGRVNIKGAGALTTTNFELTNSGNTSIFKVLDNGTITGGSNLTYNGTDLLIGGATNGFLGISGTATASKPLLSLTQATAPGGLLTYFDFALRSGGVFRVGEGSSNSATSSPIFTLISAGLNGIGPGFSSQLPNSRDVLAAGLATGIFDVQTVSSPFYVANANLFVFRNYDRPALTIAANGNISIGNFTTTINARLHVRGANTTAGGGAFLVEDGAATPSTIYRIDNDGKVTYRATNTAAGTTGAQTINRPSGTVNFAAGATALVVTNSLCTTASLVFAEVRTDDATAQIKNVVPGSGSFTINLSAAATAETSVGFFIIN